MGIRIAEDGGESWEKGERVGLLEAGLEEIGRLEERGCKKTGGQASEEVNGWDMNQ